jgi:hypothetical protein
MTPPADEPSDDEQRGLARLQEASEAIVVGVERELAGWAERSVTRILDAWGRSAPEVRARAERDAVVAAFAKACIDGDLAALARVLDPDVVVRSDGGAARPGLVSVVRGAQAVAEQAMTFRRFAATKVLVNGIPGGIAWAPDGRRVCVVSGATSTEPERKPERKPRPEPRRRPFPAPGVTMQPPPPEGAQG